MYDERGNVNNVIEARMRAAPAPPPSASLRSCALRYFAGPAPRRERGVPAAVPLAGARVPA